MRNRYHVLVAGAGIGGVRAALDLAATGRKVLLIDKRPRHGGILAQLDWQFPTDHCGMCKMLPLMERDAGSQFCLRKGLFHENIDLVLSTELVALEGDPGKFQATLRRRAPLVDPLKCIACGKCADVCPVRVPDEFNAGLGQRAAIYLPLPHSVPNAYVVDLDNCERCWRCHEACPTGAIDFLFHEREHFPILLVDPDPKAGAQIDKWLKAYTFPFAQELSCAAAIDRLHHDSETRLVLLDLSTLDMPHDRAIQRIRELRPNVTVLVMAGPLYGDKARALLEHGAADFLLHPLEKKTFISWLDKHFMGVVADQKIEVQVGAVILAVGFEPFDVKSSDKAVSLTGYGYYPGVVTAMEFERMLSGVGPSGGRLLKPGTDEPVRRIAWVQCTGSRNAQLDAEFCSSVCCMFSIKEALLARKVSHGEAETTIFYMDMRTFGKGGQRYRENAEKEHGVRFVNTMPHIVRGPDNGPDPLICQYQDASGAIVDEPFDMVVLATGARPPKELRTLAAALDVQLNHWGFIDAPKLAPERTSRLGIFAAGACGQPRDIADSLIQSGSAALSASRLLHTVDFTIEAEETETGVPSVPNRDVCREPAKVLVAFCSDCPSLAGGFDAPALAESLRRRRPSCTLFMAGRLCAQPDWTSLLHHVASEAPNRVLLCACSPYAFIPRLKELINATGLAPALLDVLDIHALTLGRETPDGLATRLSMAVARLEGADPRPHPPVSGLFDAALVVGGGLAGMTAALAIAEHGRAVVLVEAEAELGGLMRQLRSTLTGEDPQRRLEKLAGQVREHPRIDVLCSSRVVASSGVAGRFRTVIESGVTRRVVQHGATILATGAKLAQCYEYGSRMESGLVNQLELEQRLADGTLDVSQLSAVAMILCAGSREEPRNYCSRVCCSQALKNIFTLRKKNPELGIYVFYRDMMSYGFLERYFVEAQAAGVLFIRYTPENKPRVSFKDQRPQIEAFDPALGADIQIDADLLALATGMEPNPAGALAELFDVPLDRDGFYAEAEPKWRPVDFLKQGIFACGAALSPRSMPETVASAQAAAQRALALLEAKTIARSAVTAEVRHSLCSRCGRCIETCPYGARSLDEDLARVIVDSLLCQGCGACAAVCPNSATVLGAFPDGAMLEVIEEAADGVFF